MSKRDKQEGDVLIMVIGIIAALAVMAAGLVFLVANVSSNTAKERTRTKAFDVAEGALDYGMNTLGTTWPYATTANPNPSPPTFSLSDFMSVGGFNDAFEYPAPKAGLGPFASVTYYDNIVSTTGQPDSIDFSSHIDANVSGRGDGKMWLVVTGATGSQTATIQAEVNRNTYNTNFPTGVAVFTDRDLTSNGGGNNPKITIEDQGSAPSVVGIVGGNLPDPSVFQSSITPVVGNGDPSKVPSLDSLGFTSDLVNQVIALSQSLSPTGYHDLTGGGSSPTLPSDLSGVCVIRVANNSSVTIPETNAGINSLAEPGILFILGPATGNLHNITVDMRGNTPFYGVMYIEGVFESSAGNPEIHGMLVCASSIDMKGTPKILYNASAITQLADRWALSANLVPNTWRQTK